MVIKFKYYW